MIKLQLKKKNNFFKILSSYSAANCTCFDPILFLLSAGADPTSSIDELAKKKKKFPTEKVSMGEGQERVAKKAIEAQAAVGGWVIL